MEKFWKEIKKLLDNPVARKFLAEFIEKFIEEFFSDDPEKPPKDEPKTPVSGPKTPVFESAWKELCAKYAVHSVKDHWKVASFAQFILESARGESRLAKEALNFAGLKWRPEMAGVATPLEIRVPSEPGPVKFCKFKSVDDFIEGYWKFIGREPYEGWRETQTAERYIGHLQAAGYAADPDYLQKVSSLFTEARKTLNANGADIEEPDRPDKTPSKLIEPPTFQALPPDVTFDRQGSYRTPSGYAKGLVVHFTVSGRTERAAVAVARFLHSRNLGCLVMDEHGVIHAPARWLQRDQRGNYLFMSQWDDHAGKSSWRGMSSVSSYMMGMEICCWGNGAQGQGVTDVRHFTSKKENIQRGTYQKFTDEQERALKQFVLWQRQVNPDFSLDWVAGHDEVSPGRKPDPGGSLSMTMPQFRAMIEQES